jgi:rhodanese-related sulfurtransferase
MDVLVTTIGEQRRWNYALQPMSRDAFVELLTTGLPDAPAYFTHDAVLNAKERPTLDESLATGLTPLPLEHVLERRRDGAQILDTREPEDFAAAHLAGSQNIGLGGQYATWAGTILSPDRPIVIIADPGREHESAVRLGRIGFDNVVGYLRDGLQSLASRPDLTESIERLSPAAAAERLRSKERRSSSMCAAARECRKHIDQSLNLPLNHLAEPHGTSPRQAHSFTVRAATDRHCTRAFSVSEASAGWARLAGGVAAWEAAGLPLERPIPLPQPFQRRRQRLLLPPRSQCPALRGASELMLVVFRGERPRHILVGDGRSVHVVAHDVRIEQIPVSNLHPNRIGFAGLPGMRRR